MIDNIDISKMPVTVSPFSYGSKTRKFVGAKKDYAMDDVEHANPHAFRVRGNVYKSSSKHGCMIDIGSQVGATVILASDCFERCYAFEPSESSFAMLRYNIKLNEINNIEIRKVALSNFSGECDFFICVEDGNVCHSLTEEVAGSFKKEKVSVITLDSLVSEIVDCDYLHIDAEGSDMKVLMGGEKFLCEQNRHTIIEIEFAPRFWMQSGSSSKDLENFINRHGYNIFSDFGNNISPVSINVLNDLFESWKDFCYGWMDLYLVKKGIKL